MSETKGALDLLTVDIANKRIARGDSIFVFASGVLRGKLSCLTTKEAFPADTYNPSYSLNLLPCVEVLYTPGPRKSETVKDLETFNFTRKPVWFNVPVELADSCLFLRKLEGRSWMLNIVTRINSRPS